MLSAQSRGILRRTKRRLLRDAVEITKAGSHYRARFRGCANSVFGSDEKEARQRLLKNVLSMSNNISNAAIARMNLETGDK